MRLIFPGEDYDDRPISHYFLVQKVLQGVGFAVNEDQHFKETKKVSREGEVSVDSVIKVLLF